MKSEDIEITEILSSEHSKYPDRYIMFPDDIENAILRINEIDEKLMSRGIQVVMPLNVFRIIYKSNREKVPSYSMLAFEVVRIK